MRRNPGELAAGQWWQILSPLLVDTDGWPLILIKFLGIALVGTVVERAYGGVRWLALYFGAGLAGEIAGYAWQPFDAGSSVGLCGLIGGMLVLLLSRRRTGLPAVIYSLSLIWALVGGKIDGWILALILGVGMGSLASGITRSETDSGARLPVIGWMGIACAVILAVLLDIHGPALLVGTTLALGLSGFSGSRHDS